MTVLSAFTKLESCGLWRASQDAQRRDVIVALGDATLVISDTAGRPLTHWSLPAVRRINQGQTPALFAPDADGHEVLEIDDTLMIDAIDTVAKAVKRRTNRSGRLRFWGIMTLGLGAVGLAVAWLPDVMIHEAQSGVPSIKRVEIGSAMLGHMASVTGEPCATPDGMAALARLHSRAFGFDADGQTVVVPFGPERAFVLPGGTIVVNTALIDAAETPAVVAGHIIAAAAQARETDPLAVILRQSGIRTTFSLLTTGDLTDDQLRLAAQQILTTEQAAPTDDTLLDMFAAARVPSTPYAASLDAQTSQGDKLVAADPMAGQEDVAPLLDDSEWDALKAICD